MTSRADEPSSTTQPDQPVLASAPSTSTIDLTEIEVDALADLVDRLGRAKRELSIAYTFALAARGHKDCQVLETDLKNRKLKIAKNGRAET